MARTRTGTAGERDGAAGLTLPEPELILVVHPEAGVRATPSGLTAAAADAAALTDALGAEASIRPLFGATEDRLRLETATAAALPLPDLSVYYRVEADGRDLEDIAQKAQEHAAVVGAYVKPPAEPPQRLNDMAPGEQEAPPATPDFSARQGYLDPAPAGIDARLAWTRVGGRGANVQIVDVEGAWRFTHEDLMQNQGGVFGGSPTTDIGWRNHGTAVVGEFSGDVNAIGITGICPDANVRAISIFGTGMGSAVAIRQAANALRAGDVILIELHRPGPRNNFQTRSDQRGYIAVEWWPDDFDALRFATGRGVIVVEAGGNGAENLDDPIYNTPAAGFPPGWANPFNRAARDSGAIVVGAGAPPPGTHGRDWGPDRSRLDFSNYGSAVDVQGWGREVTTTGYGDLQGGSSEDVWYTDRFSGTSSASPIVVGALGSLQGTVWAAGRTPLTPARARQLLRTTGSPQQDAPGRPASERIGNRPDLRALIGGALKRGEEERKAVEKREKREKREGKELKPEKFERKELKLEAKELKREKLEAKEVKEGKELKERKPEAEKVLPREKGAAGEVKSFERGGEVLRGIPVDPLAARLDRLEALIEELSQLITGGG